MDKTPLRHAIIGQLQAGLDVQTRAALMAREEATHDESRATNKYETHGQEAAYLAGSQAKLAAEIQDSIALWTTLPLPDFASDGVIDIGALVALESRPGRTVWYLLAPRNGGVTVGLGGREITLVTPQSPLGRQLHGRRLGAVVTLPGRAGAQPHRVTMIE